MAAGYQRSHVHADSGASTPYGAFAPQRAAVPVEGSHSHGDGGASRRRATTGRPRGSGEGLPQAVVQLTLQAMWASMRGRTAMVAELRRFFSETSMIITWCLRGQKTGFGVPQRAHRSDSEVARSVHEARRTAAGGRPRRGAGGLRRRGHGKGGDQGGSVGLGVRRPSLSGGLL